MKNLLDERYLDVLGADLIIEDTANKKTYVCSIDRAKFDRSSGVEIEKQPCWSIKLIESATDSETNRNTTSIKYPNGSRNFSFAVDQIESYTYDYKI